MSATEEVIAKIKEALASNVDFKTISLSEDFAQRLFRELDFNMFPGDILQIMGFWTHVEPKQKDDILFVKFNHPLWVAYRARRRAKCRRIQAEVERMAQDEP